MKTIKLASMAVITASAAYGGGLYQVTEETESSIPLQWSVGMDVLWDDNTNPGGVADGDETFSVNPYFGLTYASVTPQTTMALYTRLGLIYYLDEPEAAGSEDTYGQSRIGFDVNHRFSERLRFVTSNYLAYELEPDYTQGVGTSRQTGEYLYWSTDNSIGFRWSERFATYTGFAINSLTYDDVANADRFTWRLYNQSRYQISQQTVLTSTYRYSETEGSDAASDSTNHYLLAGLEHSVSQNTVLVASAGAQLRELDSTGNDSTKPYVEFSMRTKVNQDWAYRAFLRYSVEDYDTVVLVGGPPVLVEFANKNTLRLGVSGEYKISPRLALFGGVNVISSSYEDGSAGAADQDDQLVNAYIGSTVKFTDNLFGTLTYNFTNSDSDIVGRDYDRNRISVGVTAEF